MAKEIPKERYSKLLKKRSTPASRERFRQRFDIKKGKSKPKPKTFEQLYAKDISAASEREFGPTERELQSQQRAEAFRTQQVGNWYTDYLNRVNAAKTESVARDAAMVTGSQQRAQQAQTQSDQSTQKLQQEAQVDAQKRGAAVNPAVFQQAQDASAARQSSANASSDFLASLGRNQATFMDQYSAAASKGAAEATTNQQNRERKLGQQIVDLSREKGAFRTDFVRKLKQDLAQQEMERGALEAQGAKINLDELRLGETIRSNKAREGLTRSGQKVTVRGQNIAKMNADRRFQLDVKKFGRSKAKDNYQRRHKVGPYSKTKGKGGGAQERGNKYYDELVKPKTDAFGDERKGKTRKRAIKETKKRYPGWKP